MPLLSLGEKAILRISADFAYSERGFDDAIPPGADLTFEVELLGIHRLPAAQDDTTAKRPKKLKPNDPCTCGSGRKFKKCCR